MISAEKLGKYTLRICNAIYVGYIRAESRLKSSACDYVKVNITKVSVAVKLVLHN